MRLAGVAAGAIDARRILFGNYSRVGRSFARGFQVVRYGLVFVQPQIIGIGTDKTLIEDPAGKQFKVLFFQGTEQASSDLGALSNVVERHTTHLALAPKPFAK